MEKTEMFFEQVITAVLVWAEAEVGFSTDPITHSSYGLTSDESRRLTSALKPIAGSSEFRRYMERAFMQCVREVFVHIDGIAANSPKVVNVVDLDGEILAQELHSAFGEFLEAHDYLQ